MKQFTRTERMLALLLVSHACSVQVFGQVSLKDVRAQWDNQNYTAVAQLLRVYRTQLYGRNLEVDYMLATSLCNISGQEPLARKRFAWIQAHYSLQSEVARIIEGAAASCGRMGPQNISYVWTSTTTRTSLMGPGVSGKIYYEWGGVMPQGDRAASFTKRIPPKEFEARLLDTTMASASVKSLRKALNLSYASANPAVQDSLVGPATTISASAHFIVVNRKGDYSVGQLRVFAERLERYLTTYRAQFGMAYPPYFITVYAAKSVDEFNTNAGLVHGLTLPKGAIGYSFQNDLSIAAVVPIIGVGQGTFNHELFHLLSRSTFGDIPPWMDEGMAALFEVSRVSSGKVKGQPNWRGKVLYRFRYLRPSIATLLSWDWSHFDNNAEYTPRDSAQLVTAKEFNQQAVNYATARYFMFYLQEKGMLEAVYTAFQQRDPELVTTSLDVDSRHTLEQAIGRPLPAIESDFQYWLHHELMRERFRSGF